MTTASKYLTSWRIFCLMKFVAMHFFRKPPILENFWQLTLRGQVSSEGLSQKVILLLSISAIVFTQCLRHYVLGAKTLVDLEMSCQHMYYDTLKPPFSLKVLWGGFSKMTQDDVTEYTETVIFFLWGFVAILFLDWKYFKTVMKLLKKTCK